MKSLIHKSYLSRAIGATQARRNFGYENKEILKLEKEVVRKFNVIRMFTEKKEFDYEPPQMYYDKQSGEIKMKEKVQQSTKKIIKNMDDLERERNALYAELELEEADSNADIKDTPEKLADKIKLAQDRMMAEFDIDPTNFYVFSRDLMRVDVGLIIQRPPIFMQMRQRDIEFLKFKSDIMNEFYTNAKQYADDFGEISKLNEDVLGDNPYCSKMNLDNYPTHKLKDPKTGEELEYCASSKHFSKVDPLLDDRKSLHFAGEDRVYLIVRNKYSKEWEFPAGKLFFGQSFMRAKQNLFNTISDGNWKIKYFGQAPISATIRQMTSDEKEDKLNKGMKGVRTYYYQAQHWRGLPDLSSVDAHDYDDFAWIPKRLLNEYFARDYYEIFVKACVTR